MALYPSLKIAKTLLDALNHGIKTHLKKITSWHLRHLLSIVQRKSSKSQVRVSTRVVDKNYPMFLFVVPHWWTTRKVMAWKKLNTPSHQNWTVYNDSSDLKRRVLQPPVTERLGVKHESTINFSSPRMDSTSLKIWNKTIWHLMANFKLPE